MADVYLSMNFKIDVTDKEMRLICMGLSGKLTRPEDIKEAHALNVRLVKAQQIRLNEKLALIGGVAKKLEEGDHVHDN